MTFTELMSLLNGNYIEVAGTSAKNQCVDLANAYIKYVLGLPAIEWANAVDFPSKAGDNYEYILNSPTGVPKEGDLVIWGGTYGHIAIFIEGNATRFTSFDENFPVGSPCHVQEHTYLSPKVLGWLHPKNVPLDIQSQLDQCRLDRDTHWNDKIQMKDGLGVVGDFSITTVMSRIDQLSGYELEVGRKDQEIEKLRQEATSIQSELNKALQVNTEAQKAIGERDKTINALKEAIAVLEQENRSTTDALSLSNQTIKNLGERIEELKQSKPVAAYTPWEKIFMGFRELFRRG